MGTLYNGRIRRQNRLISPCYYSYTVLLFQMDRDGLMDRDAKLFLVGLSTQDGKELFRKPLDVKGISYEPMLIKKSNDGRLKIVSNMYDENDKFLQQNQLVLV